jgi:chorismate lyase/3-hydroxybenzoate synthase
MNSVSATTARPGRAFPRIDYRRLAPGQPLPADALFAIHFGAVPGSATVRCGPREARVALAVLAGAGLSEIWSAHGPVNSGESGGVRFSSDDHFLSAVIEVPEQDHGGIAGATEFAYRAVAAFQASSAFPHVLRTWNYCDAINAGEGDAGRYQAFCSGRVAGLAGLTQARYPAATVIGRDDGERVLQVYWLAGREPGLALENPRQVSAYQYPRQYGETAPTFSRAMLVTPELLMISGTASIVGHASQHRDDAAAQVREIIANLDSLLARAHAQSPRLPARLGAHTLIKAYVRRRGDVNVVERELRERLPPGSPLLVLRGDVCRAELLVEFDCVAWAGPD